MTPSQGERHSAAGDAAEAALQVDNRGRTAKAEGNDQPSPRRAELLEHIETSSQVAAVAGLARKMGRPRNPELLPEKIKVLQELGVSEAVIEKLVEKRVLKRYSAMTLRGPWNSCSPRGPQKWGL